MKKRNIILSILLMLTLVFFAACGSKTSKETSDDSLKTMSFQHSSPGNNVIYTFYYEDGSDEVLKQETINTMSYEMFGVDSAEEAKEKVAPFVEQYQGLKGVEHEISYEDTYLKEFVMVDYSQVDLKEVKNIVGFELDNENATYISLEQSTAPLKAQNSGFEEVKDGKFKEFEE
ncbi:DUF1307 domain-containing protein [Streptococcus zalophi]|uniref:DUF1307 domain-containing protein n=1 Tax=Streptococcus zalophi TaxID=640031 RepID=A0A934P9D5_9STRE|nr:DUF1307 domain-containing protein [Streptococcus zalophi]MBJ8349341.1 DUF1307 domain-containing protein [Streptococcus zalophi]